MCKKPKLIIRKFENLEIDEIICGEFHLEKMSDNEVCIVLSKNKKYYHIINISSKNKLNINLMENC